MKKYIVDEPTILQLLPYVKWEDVKRAIKYYYPKDKNDYSKLFKNLKKIRKRKHKDPKERIEIDACNDAIWFKDENMWDEWYSISTNKYSMCFRLWHVLVNIPVSKETIKHYTFTDIVAHFIWEITFYGNEKQSIKTGKEIQKSANEAKKQLE